MTEDRSEGIHATISIRLVKAEGLSQSAEGSKYSAKLEYKKVTLGESAKLEQKEVNSVEWNQVLKYACNLRSNTDINSLCSAPFIVTLYEHKQKEKKQKEGKTEEIGQASFDCLPLIRGETKFEKVLKISEKKNLGQIDSPIEVQIAVSVEQPLFSKEDISRNNLVYIYVDSLQCPPEAFAMRDSSMYWILMPNVLSDELGAPITFTKGLVRTPADSEYNEGLRKWPDSGSATGTAEYIPESVRETFIDLKEEDGDFRSPEYIRHRSSGQLEKPKVVWNQEKRYHLDKEHIQFLRQNISEHKIWPLEVVRVKQFASSKGKRDEETSHSYHGVAYVNLSSLLYPGVQKIRGAYQVMPFFESEYIEKTKCPTSLLEEALQTEMKQTPSSQSKEKKGLNMVVPKTDRKINSRNVLGDAERMDGESERLGGEHGSSATDSTSLATRTAQQYVGAQSYIVIEIRLDHPLVPKRTIEEIDQKVNAYVSSRQELPTRRSTAEKAVKEYHKQIAEVSQYLLLEFKSLFASIIQNDQLPVDSESAEQLKQELFYSLNSSGKYFAFKERLKFAVIKIVREKFFRTSPFTNQEELQRFLRDLFVYLVDEMHIGLRKVFKPRELAAPVQLPILNCETLLRFAREAEDNEDYDAAKKYYQERVAREQCNSEYWVDFGTFYLGQGNMEEAEECFRKGLASDQGHIESLILCGLTAAMGERFEEAADFLEAAVTHNERNPIAWTVLGLFHQTVSNDIGSEMALNEASKLRDDEGGSDVQISVQQKTSEATAGESSEKFTTIAAVTKQDSLFEEAKPSPGLITMDETEAGSIDQGESSGWSAERKPKTDGLLSRAQSQHVRRTATMSRATKGQKSGAKSTPRENGQSLVKDKPYQPSVFVKTAKFLLDHHAYTFASAALSHELISLKKQMEANESHARKQSSSVPVQTNLAEFSEDHGLPVIDLAANGSHPKSFIQGLSEYHMLCARLFAGRASQKYDLAEQNLKLVTKLDPEAVDAWSQLGHLRFMSGAISEARHLFERCVALTTWPPNNPHLLILRLGSIYLQEREFQKAKDLFLTASKTSPTALTWLGVGAACYRLNELDNAEEALTEANFLDNRNPKVWGYLTLISLKTNRRVEAEQAYKYAIKMRLQEQSLLDEIHALQAECGFGNPLVSFETDRQCMPQAFCS